MFTKKIKIAAAAVMLFAVTISSVNVTTAKASLLEDYVDAGAVYHESTSKKFKDSKRKIVEAENKKISQNLKGKELMDIKNYKKNEWGILDTKEVKKNLPTFAKVVKALAIGFNWAGKDDNNKAKYDNETINFFNKSHGKAKDIVTGNNFAFGEMEKNITVIGHLMRARFVYDKMNKTQKNNFMKDYYNFAMQYSDISTAENGSVYISYNSMNNYLTYNLLLAHAYIMADASDNRSQIKTLFKPMLDATKEYAKREAKTGWYNEQISKDMYKFFGNNSTKMLADLAKNASWTIKETMRLMNKEFKMY